MADTKQTGQVITDGPESPAQDPGIPTLDTGYPDDAFAQTYTVVVSTRPYRFEVDGWDYTKSQTSIQIKRKPFDRV